MKSITQEQFNNMIGTGFVVVDFSAPWCGPCKMLKPILLELEEEYKSIHFVEVNVEEEIELQSKYEVLGMPTLLLFKDGEIVERIVGYQSREFIESSITHHLS